MFVNSDALLAKHLLEHPEKAREWELNHKLKSDPRVTLAGRLLRRTSLDELPQIWNVFKGEMSMVGPRPIVEGEVPRYGAAYALYAAAKPGITGLWQVSGRNNTTYRRRVELDSEYVRNWSPAVDFKILLKTFRVVLTGNGAY
jgi:lipopolysaccharide/colanic/teichoic acid biosynthesis glycosyltransferase